MKKARRILRSIQAQTIRTNLLLVAILLFLMGEKADPDTEEGQDQLKRLKLIALGLNLTNFLVTISELFAKDE